MLYEVVTKCDGVGKDAFYIAKFPINAKDEKNAKHKAKNFQLNTGGISDIISIRKISSVEYCDILKSLNDDPILSANSTREKRCIAFLLDRLVVQKSA